MSIVALDATEAIPTDSGVARRLRLTVQDNEMTAASQTARSCGGGACSCSGCDSSCDVVPCGPVYCSHC
jgi:hypothetical protein